MTTPRRDDDDRAYDGLVAIVDPPFDAAWAAWPGRLELVGLCGGDAALAKLIYRVVGSGSIAYMDAKPPVLGGRTPRSCLQSARGLKQLKAALVRYPYI
jgi:hypothetical protein